MINIHLNNKNLKQKIVFYKKNSDIRQEKNDKIMEATFEKLISYISKNPRIVTKIVALVFFLYFLGYKIGKTMALLDR